MENKFKDPKCPKCVGVLKEIETGRIDKENITVYQCGICSGILLSGETLKKILSLKVPFDDSYGKDVANDVLDQKVANCSYCNISMKRVRIKRNFWVVVDVCSKCNSIWLDGGEIRELIKGGPLRRILSWLFGGDIDVMEPYVPHFLWPTLMRRRH